MYRRMNHVTMNGTTLHYDATTVWRNGALVWTGKQVTQERLWRLSVLLGSISYTLASPIPTEVAV